MSRIPLDDESSKSVKSVNSSIPIDRKKGNDMSGNPYLDKLGICDKELEKYTCCRITGLPLFVEDIGSMYLSNKQIKYYHSHYPEVYFLLLHMIDFEHRNTALEIQIKKIAQAIRNRASYLNRKRKKRCDPNQGVLCFLD